MPVPNGDTPLLTEVHKAVELIVYQGFQRSHIDAAHRGRRILPEVCEDGKERGLGLARGGRGAKEHVGIGVEDCVSRRDLNGPQRLPVVLVHEVAHERRVPVKDAGTGHVSLPAAR